MKLVESTRIRNVFITANPSYEVTRGFTGLAYWEVQRVIVLDKLLPCLTALRDPLRHKVRGLV